MPYNLTKLSLVKQEKVSNYVNVVRHSSSTLKDCAARIVDCTILSVNQINYGAVKIYVC
jgi:hypothetical protein